MSEALQPPVEQATLDETLNDLSSPPHEDPPVVSDEPSLSSQPEATVETTGLSWPERIRNERRLPAPLRERLAAAAEGESNDPAAEPHLSVSAVAEIFAEAVPALLGLAGESTVIRHPAGDGFFQAGQLSDDDAARIAREQLARTGFAKSR
jgi:hypothetical protein